MPEGNVPKVYENSVSNSPCGLALAMASKTMKEARCSYLFMGLAVIGAILGSSFPN